MEFREDLQRYLQAMDISLQEEIIQGLCRYQGLLYAANDHTNLTSIEERDSALLNFADSLSALKDIPAHGTLLDMGTGAGLPGLALAIARPDLQCTLVDATQKKIAFVQGVAQALGLANVRCLQARAEQMAHEAQHRQTYDICVARAVAALPTLAEYCLPFVRIGGCWIAYKGAAAAQETSAARGAVKVLGGGRIVLSDAKVPGRTHFLIRVEKTAKTPERYPRKGALARKNPLK